MGNPNASTVFEKRAESMAKGMALGHQMGQWSERRWWRFPADKSCYTVEDAISIHELTNPDRARELIEDPPVITTPGWAPTCFIDTVPHITALGMEYSLKEKALSPEDIRDFLLRERTWLRPQGVGRTCIELMDEGMNPRIAGLFAPSVLSGCWMAWPAALYNAGYPEDAYEEACILARTQNGGDITALTGLLAAALAAALIPGMTWAGIKNILLKLSEKRDEHIAENLRLALAYAETGRMEDWLKSVREDEFKNKFKVYNYGLDWISSFYASMSLLEFTYLKGTSWPEFIRLSLMSTDVRFGSMIAVSIRAAVEGEEEWPRIWKDTLRKVHENELAGWVEKGTDLVKRKLLAENELAGKVSNQIGDVIETSDLYDRILAAMLAGAAGNVMGSPVEDRDYDWIEEKYGVLDKILDPGRLDTEDDSAMAIMWAETYIRCEGRVFTEDLAETFRQEMNRNNFYYDSQHAYDLMIKGLAPHACGHWNVVTGSALMGCNPCGMYHVGNPAQAAADALELSYLYQRGFDVYAAAILCAATAEALTAEATVESVLEAALKAAPPEPQAYFNRLDRREAGPYLKKVLNAVEGCMDVLEVRKILYGGFLEYNGQDPWEVVAFTLAIFKVSGGDIWKCMVGGTNIGRDSDTIASQSALLSACLKGTDGLPEHILDFFGEAKISRYKSLAAGICRIVADKCGRAREVLKCMEIGLE